MKKWIALALALTCVLTLAACKKEMHLEIGHAASLSLRSGLTGDAAEITDTEVIAYITENLNAIPFEKGRMPNEGENGYAYSLCWYDEDRLIADLVVMDEYTVLYDGYYYNGMEADNEIDTEYLRMLTKKQDSGSVPVTPEDTWGVTMSVKDATPAGLTLVIIHSGDAPGGMLQTGSPYWVERWQDGEWLSLDNGEERAWTMEAWPIPMNGSREDEVNWVNLYGQLPAGQYRLGKEIMLFRGPGDYGERSCYAEFVIE